MTAKYFVTVTYPCDNCDGATLCEFDNSRDAIAFAAKCAESINHDDWIECVHEQDGDYYDALDDFNSQMRFANDSGLMGNYVIAIGRVYSQEYVLNACKG